MTIAPYERSLAEVLYDAQLRHELRPSAITLTGIATQAQMTHWDPPPRPYGVREIGPLEMKARLDEVTERAVERVRISEEYYYHHVIDWQTLTQGTTIGGGQND